MKVKKGGTAVGMEHVFIDLGETYMTDDQIMAAHGRENDI